ncbi:hepatic sodium/bile acid cotransporter-like [Oncorhynchus masou masou]|uniref:hepatic sodium/bile acid cotransporter-like n=1 Tax=Oncorhynchus masou masou TaxID=90313 RepID=UPI0031830B52
MGDTIDTAMGVFSYQYLASNDSLLFNITPTHFPPLPPIIDMAISFTTIVILFVTMVSLGCNMEVSKIKTHILKPKGVAIAVVAQFGVMPLTAFSLAKVLQLGPMEAVAVLICGCCPGGNISNILALALKGDVNLSIVMTTCSTFLALGMMPLLLYLYCQGFSNLESAVPYVGITLTLVMTLFPCGIGILINYYRPQYSKTITKIGLSLLLISMVVIGLLASVTRGRMNVMQIVLSPQLMATAALMPLIGYTLGYVLSYLFRVNRSGQRTIAMETGCQNIQLCSAILKVAFPPDVIGPLYLFPIVYIGFQVGEALLLIVLFWVHQRFFKTTKKEKRVYEAVKLEEAGQPSDVAI